MKPKVLLQTIQNLYARPIFHRSYGLLILLLLTSNLIQSQNIIIYNSDNNLTSDFLNSLCTSIRLNEENIEQNKTEFERLINIAAQTNRHDSLQPQKIREWFLKYRKQCECETFKKFNAGHIIEWIIKADFRDAANLIGPNGRLDMALETPYSKSEITALQYTREQLDLIEAKFKNERVRFQKNKDWKRLIFYLMLFTEYQVQYDVKMEELK